MKSKRKIVVSKEDFVRLETLFSSDFAAAFSDKPYLKSLRGELSVARVLLPADIPPCVVTMNSTVRLLDVRSKEIETYTLVYPTEANIAEGKLSVLAPIGTAILGCRVGEIVRWQVPRGTIHLRIEELVYQPERDCVAA